MLKYTTTNLKKLETLFKELNYKIRYEKGHFQSGYCIVNHQNMIIINKFYKTEARMNCLIEILQKMEETEVELVEENLALYTKVREAVVKD
ncbi:MAG: hypothetical protein GY810_31625 [Aureispira sp.]|nr:hypothetical protein [Aureispira sp.]